MPESSEARERVLNVAEKLFSERGYAAVTLKDIAQTLEIRQASLYFHFPEGKEQLFVAVTERMMDKHRSGLETAINNAGADLGDQLRSASRWLLNQPPMDFGRMASSDMPAISEVAAERLMQVTFDSVMMPLMKAFSRPESAHEADHKRAALLAGSFLAVIETIHQLPNHWELSPKEEMADTMIDVFLNGIR
jgi:TetR/AcrR family transcriptional regulator, cholesterol catabolism regulator